MSKILDSASHSDRLFCVMLSEFVGNFIADFVMYSSDSTICTRDYTLSCSTNVPSDSE